MERLRNELRKHDPNFDIVKDIITATTNDDFNGIVIDDNRRYLIHYCCWKKAPVGMIQDLITQYPPIVQYQDKYGRYPLYYAVRYHPNDVVVQYLIQEYPQAAQAHKYLLHYACARNRSKNVILLLLRAFPEAVRLKDFRGWYPLQIVCCHYTNHQESEAVIRSLLDEYPRAIDETDDSPFYIACCFGQPEPVLRLLLSEYPRIIRQPDRCGNYPFHYACYNRSEQLLRFLLNEYPEAVRQMNSDHQYPIHIACAVPDQSESIIRFLLQEYPEAIEQMCSNRSQYPLHIACATNQSDSIIRLLIEQYPDAVQHKDNSGPIMHAVRGGRYPLHWACSSTVVRTLDIIELLIHQYPIAVYEKDCTLQYPLHIACKSYQSEPVLQLLLQMNPEAQYLTDKSGFLPADYFSEHRYDLYSWLLTNNDYFLCLEQGEGKIVVDDN